MSAGHFDETLATDDILAYTFDRVEARSPRETVELEIDLLPIGLTFYPRGDGTSSTDGRRARLALAAPTRTA